MQVCENEIWKKRGNLIRSARVSKGLYQKDVAKAIGVKNNTFAQYEYGIRKIDIDTAVEICQFLDIKLSLFLGYQNRKIKF